MTEENKNVLDQMFQDKLKEKSDAETEATVDTFNYVVVLDRSGSMNSIRDDAMGGLNSYVEEQKKEKGKATFSLIQFDDVYGDPQYWLKDIQDVEPLTKETYIPRSMTALLDAIGKTVAKVRELRASGEMEGKVQFVIQTDGGENASREFTTTDAVKNLVDAVEKEGWGDFIFLGANIDAFGTGGSMGISAGTTANYAFSEAGVRGAFAYADVQSKSFRHGVTMDSMVVDDLKECVARGGDFSELYENLNSTVSQASTTDDTDENS